MITDPLFYLLAVPALLATGIGKGGFGAGLGIVAVPAMTLVVPPLLAAGVMLPILCFMDVFGVWAYRRNWSRRLVLILLPGAVAGIALAALLADRVEENHIRLIIGAVAVLFALDWWIGRRGGNAARPPNRASGSFWAAVSGFTSFVGHAGGPPISVFLLPLKLDKTIYVGTTAIFFAAVNYMKLVPYGWLGLLNQTTLTTALVLAPVCPIGIWLGIWLHNRVSPGLFYRACYVFVFLVGCKLLWDGLRSITG
ncbi:MAG: sulfite exporter TauE/SafE family protein [Minwuiales bacterium]|nr:sulfite exporter TauE/SafE family protein [Minwuiales bacterium]